jgi:hypothetical protein
VFHLSQEGCGVWVVETPRIREINAGVAVSVPAWGCVCGRKRPPYARGPRVHRRRMQVLQPAPVEATLRLGGSFPVWGLRVVQKKGPRFSTGAELACSSRWMRVSGGVETPRIRIGNAAGAEFVPAGGG